MITLPCSAQFGGGRGGGGAAALTGSISGEILDDGTGEALPYATVVLLTDTGRETNGDVTDEKGRFKLQNIKLGSYSIVLSYIGYASDTITGLELTKKDPDFKMDASRLSLDQVRLGTVEVVEERSLIENQLDKIVYNADQDATNNNGDATDVLRKVPMVGVDLQGNVSIRGSQNIQVLVNGKPSSMFSDNPADAMKMIPSEQIKKVEVMTSPSAKYDSEGSGGIINIITKQSRVKGFSGNVDISAGSRQNSANVNMNLAQGRFGFNASGFAFYSVPVNADNTFKRIDFLPGEDRVMTQDGVTKTSRLGFNGRLGAYYDFNAFNSINTSFRLGGFTFDQDGVTTLLLENPMLDNISFDRINEQNRLTNNYDWTTDFTKKFQTEGQELTAALQINGNQSNLQSDLDQVAILPGSPAFVERTDNDGDNIEYTAQLDYTHPFSDKLKLETGVKGIFRDITSDFDYSQLNDQGQYILDDVRSNEFRYDQDVMAAYVSFNIKLNDDIGIVAGTRYEQTAIKGDFQEGEPISVNDYDNILPSITVSKKFKNFSTIKASYNQRIQRPSLFFLNPFRNDIDRFNITTGNPELNPELSSQYELNYTTFVKGTVINASVFYKRTQDIITPVQQLDGATAITRYENAATNNSVGFNVFTSVNLWKKFDLRGSINMFTFDAEGTVGGLELANSGLMYNGFISGSLKLPKDWRIDAFSFFNSRRITLQGEVPSFSFFQMGVVKDIFPEKRGTIGLRLVEPFFPVKTFATDLSSENFSQVSRFDLPFFSIGINFKYKFGKLNFQGEQRRSKIKNQDLKSGDDGGGQGMGGQG